MSDPILLKFNKLFEKALLFIPLLLILNSSCETRGDKFPPFGVKERLLGTIPRHDINRIFFINETVGFVVISKDTLLRTDDGCLTFRRVLADSSSFFLDVQFVNSHIGFVLDRNDHIFKTTDSGDHWEKINISAPDASLKAMKCLNGDTLFIAAGTDSGLKDGYIICSRDGGLTWDARNTKDLYDIFFINDSTGFACGSSGIIRTRDAGKSWDTISDQPSANIIFLDDLNGYCSDKRSLYRTSDGGLTWKLARTIINPSWIVGEDFSRIECLNALNDKDLIFSLNARLIKVTPGQKWFQYEFTRPYYQLQMLSRKKGIVYGFEKMILVDFN